MATLQFSIKAFTPGTLPMKRLSEYLLELAVLLGPEAQATFDRVVKGSAVAQICVPDEQLTSTVARARSVMQEDSGHEVRRAFSNINRMLAENNTTGRLRVKGGAQILVFPGIRAPSLDELHVSQFTEVDGVVIRVGGTDRTIPVTLRDLDGTLHRCYVTSREVARELAKLLFEEERPIRVSGEGEWDRTSEGAWVLKTLRIDSYRLLDPAPLKEVFQRLAAVPGNGWAEVDDIDREARFLRHGE